MSLFNPPNSPSTGVTYSFGSNIWEWNGYAWIKEGTVSSTPSNELQIYWSTPSYWLEMPSMTEGDQKIAALYAIYPGGSGASGVTASGNFFAFGLSGCTYIVDWGNGITQLYTTGATASYAYEFTGLTFVSAVTGGYKQILMQAYPETSGNTFSAFDFRRRYSVSGITLTTGYSESILSLKLCSNTVNRLLLGDNNKRLNDLYEFEYVGPSGITNATTLFYFYNSNITSIKGTQWTSKIINASYMFTACTVLDNLPLFDFSSLTIAFNMFDNCQSLRTVPFFNFSNLEVAYGMFSGCYSLRNIPNFDFSKILGMSNFFTFCYSLETIPHFNIPNCTTLANFASQCSSLRSVGGFSGTGLTLTTVNNLFQLAKSLKEVPWFDTSSVTNFDRMFDSSQITTIPKYNTSKANTAKFMFNSCPNLQTLPELDFSGSTSTTFQQFGFEASSPFGGSTPSLKNGIFRNANGTLSYESCNLSPAALNDIFTYLGVTGAGKTIRIAGNWGASGCNRSIATAKGWTVTG
jgi:hypothetical protein